MPTEGKRYRIQDGLALKEIVGVKKHTSGPVMMVQYTVGDYYQVSIIFKDTTLCLGFLVRNRPDQAADRESVLCQDADRILRGTARCSPLASSDEDGVLKWLLTL